MLQTKRRITVSLPAELVDRARLVVADGSAPTLSALFEQALVRYLHELRRARIRADLVEAVNDPLFIADIEEVRRDFAASDAELLRRFDEEEGLADDGAE